MEILREATGRTLLGTLLLPTVAALACAPARPLAEPLKRSPSPVEADIDLASVCSPVRLDTAAAPGDPGVAELPPPVLLERDALRSGNPLATYAAMRDREAAYMAHPVWSRIYPEMRLNFEQFLGLPCAGLQAMAFPSLAQDYGEATGRISESFTPRDALDVLVQAAESTRFVIWGEEHHLSQTRSLYEPMLRRLRLLGYRYLAAETFAELPPDGLAVPTAETGFYVLDPVFASAIRVALELGYELVAYDPGGDLLEGGPSRDEIMAQRIAEQTIARDSTARVLVLAGRAHAAEVERDGWVPMALALRRITGVDPFTVYAPQMTERLDKSHEHPLYRDAAARGLLDVPRIFVDNTSGACTRAAAGSPCLLGSDAFDAYVFWPRVRLAAGRPDWMLSVPDRTPIDIPRALLSADGSWLVQSRRPADPVEAIPLDQILVREASPSPALVLPPGENVLRSVDRHGVVYQQTTVIVPLPPALDSTRRELIEMGETDQAYRDYDRVMAMPGTEREEFMERAAEADRRHAIRLGEIVERNGWPDRDRFGPEASRAAFLIVQHAGHDPEFQERMLPLVETAARSGTIEPAEVAFLTDRVRVSQGRPQAYGTQYGFVQDESGGAVADAEGNLQYLPPVVEDPDNLDDRRAEMGLGPWREYDRRMAQDQGREPFDGPGSAE